jgi:diaminohydroxyphosphoribosylaminopyrimidine deaminase/5-amino-6-(5-phosphoribosylamino)uracil reductase
MRATNDAILTGIGTVLADDPLLTCRLPGIAARSPVRVVLDTRLRLPAASALVRSAGEIPVWIMAGADAPAEAEAAMVAHGVKVFRIPNSSSPSASWERGGLDLHAVLHLLADHGITRLMVEAGPIVNAAFLAADLVDAAALLRGPAAIGADGINALEGMPLTVLTASPRLLPRVIETVGADTIETFERA